MIDTRSSFAALLNDPALDNLLALAQSKIAEMGITDGCDTIDDINKVASTVQANAQHVRSNLIRDINAKVALRKEKVAIAVHMLKVASRLSA